MRGLLFLPVVLVGTVTLIVEAIHAALVSCTEELARLRGDL